LDLERLLDLDLAFVAVVATGGSPIDFMAFSLVSTAIVVGAPGAGGEINSVAAGGFETFIGITMTG